jgi:hypothetical protein
VTATTGHEIGDGGSGSKTGGIKIRDEDQDEIGHQQRGIGFVLEFNSRANIRHSGRHGRRSVLDFDIQGDTDRCVRIRQSGRHDRGSMLEFDIAHNTIRGSRQQAQFDVRGSGDRETGLGGRGSGETGWSTR